MTRLPPNVPDLSGLVVLLVDDNDDALEMLTTFVKACHAEVLVARDGSAALSYIDSAPKLDVVVSDLAMPGIDGIALARRLRRHPARRSVPLIAVTGFYEDFPNAEEFDAYLRKPIDLDRLCDVIRSLTRR